jgi:hypothetical protein
LALQCVHEAVASQDEDEIDHWNLVLDAIEALRGRMAAARQQVH